MADRDVGPRPPKLFGIWKRTSHLRPSHALVGVVQRVLSLTGMLTISYPFWRTIDRRQADLQDLFFNEPWFLIEGLLWAAMAWVGALRVSPRRLWWIGSAVAATAALTAMALMSAFGVIGQMIIG